MEIVFAVLTLSSLGYAAVTGHTEALGAAVLSGAADAVGILIGMAGVSCFFAGILAVFGKAGALVSLSRLLSPFLRFAFPVTGEDTRADIAAAMTANLLGMGNAATPAALSALGRMKKESPCPPGVASDPMIALAVVNTAPATLIPTGILALRHASGSTDAAAVLLPIALVSTASMLFAVCFCRVCARLFPYRDTKQGRRP